MTLRSNGVVDALHGGDDTIGVGAGGGNGCRYEQEQAYEAIIVVVVVLFHGFVFEQLHKVADAAESF